MHKLIKLLQTLLLLVAIMLLISCNTVRTVYITRTVVPTYTFSQQPEVNDDAIVGVDYVDHVSIKYFRELLAYFTMIDSLQMQYNIDKEYYERLNKYIEENREP